MGIVSLIMSSHDNPTLIGSGILAYTFGLRHAFDVDHIAAIDNTVRKLLEERQNPSGVGFFFSIGHSTIVFVLTLLTAVATQWVQQSIPLFERFGGMRTVSGIFLLTIGGFNFIVLISIFRLLWGMRHNRQQTGSIEKLLESRGFFIRLIKPLTKFVYKSWHIYLVGFLFGLGFDTASEVALLTISSLTVKHTHSIGAVLGSTDSVCSRNESPGHCRWHLHDERLSAGHSQRHCESCITPCPLPASR